MCINDARIPFPSPGRTGRLTELEKETWGDGDTEAPSHVELTVWISAAHYTTRP